MNSSLSAKKNNLQETVTETHNNRKPFFLWSFVFFHQSRHGWLLEFSCSYYPSTPFPVVSTFSAPQVSSHPPWTPVLNPDWALNLNSHYWVISLFQMGLASWNLCCFILTAHDGAIALRFDLNDDCRSLVQTVEAKYLFSKVCPTTCTFPPQNDSLLPQEKTPSYASFFIRNLFQLVHLILKQCIPRSRAGLTVMLNIL